MQAAWKLAYNAKICKNCLKAKENKCNCRLNKKSQCKRCTRLDHDLLHDDNWKLFTAELHSANNINNIALFIKCCVACNSAAVCIRHNADTNYYTSSLLYKENSSSYRETPDKILELFIRSSNAVTYGVQKPRSGKNPRAQAEAENIVIGGV